VVLASPRLLEPPSDSPHHLITSSTTTEPTCWQHLPSRATPHEVFPCMSIDDKVHRKIRNRAISSHQSITFTTPEVLTGSRTDVFLWRLRILDKLTNTRKTGPFFQVPSPQLTFDTFPRRQLARAMRRC
jgi:hypothetical protein